MTRAHSVTGHAALGGESGGIVISDGLEITGIIVGGEVGNPPHAYMLFQCALDIINVFHVDYGMTLTLF